MTRTLTIVGASVRAAACSAARAGYSLHVGDVFGDLDLPAGCAATRVDDYPEGLARIVRGPQSGGWMYTGALENYPRLVHDLATARPLWGNPADVLEQVRDPMRVAKVLHTAGLPCPDVLDGDAGVPGEGKWLVKPLRSAGGVRITAVDHSTQSKAALAPDCYFQQYVAGEACAALYLAAQGRAALLGITRQLVGEAWTGAEGYRYCGSIGPLPVSERILHNFVRIGEALSAAFGIVGLVGVDAILNEQGVWPVEINPRYPASAEVLERACDFSAVELHLDACQHGRLPEGCPLPSSRVHGKAIVFAKAPVAVTSDLRWCVSSAVESDMPTLADIPTPPAHVEAGWPIATVLANAESAERVLALLQQRVREVQAAVETARPAIS